MPYVEDVLYKPQLALAAGIVANIETTALQAANDITGDDNALATSQSGNSGASLTADIDGSDGDFQFTQNMTTTCTPA